MCSLTSPMRITVMSVTLLTVVYGIRKASCARRKYTAVTKPEFGWLPGGRAA